jgi:hypothetical protein
MQRFLFVLAAMVAASLALPSSASAASCMATEMRPVAQVPENEWGKLFYVIIDDTDAAAFKAKGLSVHSCRTAFADEADEALYRDRICAMASYGNEAVQNQFTRALGVPPKELCETAERALGPASEAARSNPKAFLGPPGEQAEHVADEDLSAGP